MILRRAAFAVSVLACLAASLVVAAPPALAGIVSRYASPTGTSADTCAQSDPCDIVTAINSAPADVAIVLAPGSYGSAKHPIAVQLQPVGHATITTTSPGSFATVYTDSPDYGLLVYDSSVSYLRIFATVGTSGLGLVESSTANHVAVYDNGAAYGACTLDGSMLSDSLCAEAGDGRPAIGISTAGSGTTADTLLNVTAAASGAHGIGMSASESGVTYTIDATNSIFQGADYDLRATATGGAMTINLTHSDANPAKSQVNGATATITRFSGNIAAAARFTDPAARDFTEKASSPTVDAGQGGAASDTDLAGWPRTLGTITDIGAYEFPEKPKVHHLTLVKARKTSATFTVHVNGERLASEAWLVARAGKHSYKSAKATVPASVRETVKLTLTGLPTHTKLVARTRAKSLAGTTKAGHLTFRT